MSGSRPRGSSRRFNLRLVALLLVAVAVFLGVIVAVGSLTRSYTVLVANQQIVAGTTFAENMFTPVHVNGDAPTTPEGTASVSRPLTEAELGDYYGRLVINSLYPGSILETGDFYAPVAFDPADPTKSFATHLTELLGPNQRALVIEGDPTSTFAQVGDYIDVVWLPDTEKLNAPTLDAAGNPVAPAAVYANSAQRLFTKRIVYAVPRPPIDPAAGNPADQTTGTIFILDLSAQESQDLIWAQANGTLRITLAGPDFKTDGTQVTTPGYFNGTYNITTGPAITPAPSVEPTPEPTVAPSETPPGLPSASPAP